jgi:hypothetical protein
MHYDLAKADLRTLVGAKVDTLRPAVSPDGRKIALARLTEAGDKGKLQILFYDLQGKEVDRSPELNWPRLQKEQTTTAVYWAGMSGKLIVHDFNEPGNTGIYDLAKKTLIVMPGWPLPFGGTPIRPDEAGFLLGIDQKADPPKVVWADWTGKQQPVPIKGQLKEEQSDVLLMPWTGTSRWDDAVAEVAYGSFRIRLDTVKLTGQVHELPVKGEPVLQAHVFAKTGTKIQVVEEKKDDAVFRLELIPAGKKPQALHKIHKDRFIFSASPDGKWLAIRSIEKGEPIVLVDRDGVVKNVGMRGGK